MFRIHRFLLGLAIVATCPAFSLAAGITAPHTSLAVPVISWNPPAAIVSGTAIDDAQLNATANVAGVFTYSPAAGTVLAPGWHTLSVAFTPDDPTRYNAASASVRLAVKTRSVITWPAPAPIAAGAALTRTQLNAVANNAGALSYTPKLGTVLPAGNHILSVTFTPYSPGLYTAATASVTLVVGGASKTTPAVTWSQPPSIDLGVALSSAHLNAAASVPGAFTYTPEAGTVLPAGVHTLSAAFTPADPTRYHTASASTTITVTAPVKVPPAITWAAPAAVPQGTALSATQLNASASVPGTFVYTPAAGTALAAGTHTLSAVFTPADTVRYTQASAAVTLTVNATTMTTPTLKWATPASITQGTPLSKTQLCALAGTPGTFVYTPAAGTVLPAGTHTLSVVFTPLYSTRYNVATKSVTLTVLGGTSTAPTITWATPATIEPGTALSDLQLNATASVAGTFAYAPAAGTVLAAGTHPLTVTFTPADLARYTTATKTVSLTVAAAPKTTPALTWATPASISAGTPLSGTQLNATASVPGTFAYAPAAGTVLAAGTHTLTTTFTPADLAAYTTATKSVSLTVTTGTKTPSGCVLPTSTSYPGFDYRLPTARPFISLDHYNRADRASVAYSRFKSAADAAVRGAAPYGYTAMQSVTMYAMTGDTRYIDEAIARVEAVVTAAEAAIAAGTAPAVAFDSYLKVGGTLEQLAFTYDYGYGRLTDAQRLRWATFAEQTLFNLWNPKAATWGGVAMPWSGWALCDPANNYHFSFLRATMMWALATQSRPWLDFLQAQKFGPLVDYYAQLPGGGSTEGTGYGVAQGNLFFTYLYWLDSTNEDFAALTAHTRETIEYWMHATVPTLDRFAPIGDQSRSSIPSLFDYHENLVQYAVSLAPGTTEARHGTWWLQHNSVDGVRIVSNLFGDLLPLPDAPLAPTDLTYHAKGPGAFFARSNWTTDATWLAIVAGRYDQSHAHQDQGGFTLFRRDWLAVTANIWSRSGVHQDVAVHNVLRFERPDGTTVPQTRSASLRSTVTTETDAAGGATLVADLSNVYFYNKAFVQHWTRRFEFHGDTLRVTDTCAVADGVRPVFQLHVPVEPVRLDNGTVVAGNLTIVPLQEGTVTWSAMAAPEYSKGYRLDFTSATGCAFAFDLRAQ